MKMRRLAIMAISVAAMHAIAGCKSLTQLAPPVNPAVVSAGEKRGASNDTLAEGRRLYVTKCAACHTPEPVDGHTPEQWAGILPRMGKEAKLTPEQLAAVHAYVLAARDTLVLP